MIFFHNVSNKLFCLHYITVKASDKIDAPAPEIEAEIDKDLFYDSKNYIKFSFEQK